MRQIALKIAALAAGSLLVLSLVFGLVLLMATNTADKNTLTLLDTSLRENFDRLVRTQVENVCATLKIVYDRGQGGEMTPDQAQVMAKDILRGIRYNKDGYFWADTIDGVNVVLLGKADVEGKSRWNSKDAQGKYFIQEIIAQGRQSGGGFTNYWFPRAGQTEPLPKRSYSLLFEPYGWVIGTGNYVDDIQTEVENKRHLLEAESTKLKLVILAVILLGFVGTGISSYAVGRRLSRPIKSVAHALQDIASGEGDLTRKLELVTHDETAEIAGSFNTFSEKLHDMIIALRSSTVALSNIGQSLSANLVESASALNQITANIGHMQNRISAQSTSINETTNSVLGISQGIDSLNQLVETQAASVSHSSAAIEQMVSNIASVAENVDRISAQFESLMHAAENGKNKLSDANQIIIEIVVQSNTLGEANTIIANIASQTNLLAMNAAIEAAHAGEAGKGFSVVSDEIRKLAENASEQSRAVEENIKAIQTSIQKVVAASSEAEQAFEETRTMIQHVNELESTVKLSMVEQNEGSKQILNALSEINRITGEVRDSSTNMTSSSQQIRSEMERLSDITAEINGGMSEISIGAVEINQSINEISELGVRNKDFVEKLNAETSRFKVRG